jgi:hypothetical protein
VVEPAGIGRPIFYKQQGGSTQQGESTVVPVGADVKGVLCLRRGMRRIGRKCPLPHLVSLPQGPVDRRLGNSPQQLCSDESVFRRAFCSPICYMLLD